jgi:putative nucleotidyltransferase with HDIG domain
LGVSNNLVAPVQPAALIAAVSAARDRVLEASWQERQPLMRDALVASRSTFTSAFDDVRKTGHVDIGYVADTCGLIAQSVKDESFSDWLAAIKNHHDYTYRHCMFVCGPIVHFAESIGVKGDDLNLLSLGGMLHDIGKARVPLQILDKPGRLTNTEQVTMRNHPAHSREIMATLEGLDPRAVAMAVHHHEKLDGSGYPDGLKGAQIDDLVRLTSIADVFSALIDERSYKPAMTYEAAFAKMESMEGHLDLEMLGRFKDFAMTARPKAA